MAKLIITYTIKDDGKRAVLKKFIEDTYNEKPVDQSCFLIVKNLEPSDIYARIQSHLQKTNNKLLKDDVVHVFKISSLKDAYAGTDANLSKTLRPSKFSEML